MGLWVDVEKLYRQCHLAIMEELNNTLPIALLQPVDLYVLQALYLRDGQQASELARAVGRAATSFTPILDKLQSLELVERRPSKVDRRAVDIFLTPIGEAHRESVVDVLERAEGRLQHSAAEWIVEIALPIKPPSPLAVEQVYGGMSDVVIRS